MKMGFSRKMRKRLAKIDKLMKKGLNQEEIKEYFIDRLRWKKDKFYRTWHSFMQGVVVVHSKPRLEYKIKKFYNKKEKCYFCNSNKTIEHHISYCPEKIIYVCSPCHLKIHFVIKQYHINNIEKDKIIKNLEKKIINISKIINPTKFWNKIPPEKC